MKWTTKSIYFDIDTGEIIPPWVAKENYTTIKKSKNVQLSKEAFKGTVEYTYHCRKKGWVQQKLQF